MQHSYENPEQWQDTVAVTTADGPALLDQAETEERKPTPSIELKTPRATTLRLVPRSLD